MRVKDSTYLINFHLIKDGVVKVSEFLWPAVEGELASQFFSGQTRFGGLTIEQPDFDHIAAFGLSPKTAGSQIRHEDEAFEQTTS